VCNGPKHPRTPCLKAGVHRAQRYVHLALLPRWANFSRALPLRLVPAFPPKAVAGAEEPRRELAAPEEFVRLDAAGRLEQRALGAVRSDGLGVDL
jgi:hypothetical protein